MSEMDPLFTIFKNTDGTEIINHIYEKLIN